MYSYGAEITSKRVDFEIINLSKRVWSGLRFRRVKEFLGDISISSIFPIAGKLKLLEVIGNIN